jgi:hypothetical protein
MARSVREGPSADERAAVLVASALLSGVRIRTEGLNDPGERLIKIADKVFDVFDPD